MVIVKKKHSNLHLEKNNGNKLMINNAHKMNCN